RSRISNRARLLRVVGCQPAVADSRGPVAQQRQGVMRGRPGLDRVGKQAETLLSRDREGFEGKVQVPDDRVVDALDAGGVDPDVVGSPSDSELLAAGG